MNVYNADIQNVVNRGEIKMNRHIAKFHKVSEDQFVKDVLENNDITKGSIKKYLDDYSTEFTNSINTITDEVIERFIRKEIYPNIKLPKRATIGSAGYDFFFPFPKYILTYEESIKIPTGIKCEMDIKWVLTEHVRSGMGFKHQITMSNTVGIIDADYYNNKDNEGHIFVKLVNRSLDHKSIVLKRDEGYCQGVFLMYGLTIDDNTDGTRIGGLGSTNIPNKNN